MGGKTKFKTPACIVVSADVVGSSFREAKVSKLRCTPHQPGHSPPVAAPFSQPRCPYTHPPTHGIAQPSIQPV